MKLSGAAFDAETGIPKLKKENKHFSLFTAQTLSAILAWSKGSTQDAWQGFERAGQLVEASDFLHDRGLVAERTAAFYRHLGMARLAREREHALP